MPARHLAGPLRYDAPMASLFDQIREALVAFTRLQTPPALIGSDSRLPDQSPLLVEAMLGEGLRPLDYRFDWSGARVLMNSEHRSAAVV